MSTNSSSQNIPEPNNLEQVFKKLFSETEQLELAYRSLHEEPTSLHSPPSAKLRALQEAVQRADRLQELGGLAAHLAHEIRNPLGGMRGFASILKQELHDRPDLQNMASSIIQGADELSLLVSNILQYARPFSVQLDCVDIVDLVQEVRQLLIADSDWNDQITFTVRTIGEARYVPLDPQFMKSALLNLCKNAIQAMPKGGELIVCVEIDRASLYIWIKDQGIGIPKENLGKLFSPFFTTKEKGNGLGLAEVQKVVQAHFGTIDVESVVGEGTLFMIQIPLRF